MADETCLELNKQQFEELTDTLLQAGGGEGEGGREGREGEGDSLCRLKSERTTRRGARALIGTVCRLPLGPVTAALAELKQPIEFSLFVCQI